MAEQICEVWLLEGEEVMADAAVIVYAESAQEACLMASRVYPHFSIGAMKKLQPTDRYGVMLIVRATHGSMTVADTAHTPNAGMNAPPPTA